MLCSRQTTAEFADHLATELVFWSEGLIHLVHLSRLLYILIPAKMTTNAAAVFSKKMLLTVKPSRQLVSRCRSWGHCKMHPSSLAGLLQENGNFSSGHCSFLSLSSALKNVHRSGHYVARKQEPRGS